MIPENTAHGTYFLEITFELLDGESFIHRELLAILSEEEGISVYGMMTIPSLPHGIDTILVSILAIFLLIRGKRVLKERKIRKTIDFDSILKEDVVSNELYPEVTYTNTGFEDQGPAIIPAITDNLMQSLESTQLVQSPTYESIEHPIGSGTWWERNHSSEEWRKI